MKAFIKVTLRYFSDLLIEIRSVIWSLSPSKKHKLKILKGHSYWFTSFGDIPKLLYKKQHLVSREKSFEYDVLTLYKSLIKPGNVVLDIGANVGLFSLLGADLIGPDKGKIYAFEPAKDTFDALKKNIGLNNVTDKIELYALALSDKAGFVEMQTPSTNDSFVQKDAFAYIKNSDEKTGIEANTMDAFIEENKIAKVDLIKIDIEGAELLCLKGGINTLKNHQPIVLFESFEPTCERFDYTVFDLLKFLADNNYNLTQINEHQWLAVSKN